MTPRPPSLAARLAEEARLCGAVLASFLRPRPVEIPFYLFALAGPLLYWVLVALLRPDEPFAAHIIYRSRDGDPEYLPLFFNLARGHVGDGQVFEMFGRGIVSFPLLLALPFSLPIALFGQAGFAVGDVAVGIVFFLAARAWCLACSRNALWSSAVAAMLVAGTTRLLAHPMGRYYDWSPLTVWQERIPRPYVTDVYFLLALLVAIALVSGPRARGIALLWGVAGAMVAVLVQSTFYNVFAFLPVLPLLLWLFWKDGAPARVWVRNAACLAAGGVLGGWPWAMQRLGESPEVLRWWGEYDTSRIEWWRHPYWLFAPPLKVFLLGLALLAAPRLVRPPRPWPMPPLPGPVLALLALMGLFSCIAIPLLPTLAGKTIEPYHFDSTLKAMVGFVWIAVIAWYGANLAVFLPVRLPLSRARAGIVAAGLLAVCLGGLGLYGQRVVNGIRFERPIRYDEHGGPRYRTSLGLLIHELERPEYRDCRVLGTFAHEPAMWWAGPRGGFLFCPDVTAISATTTASDFERRIALLGHQLGLSPDAFGDLIGRSQFLQLWLGANLYQLSRMYAAAPLDDYPPAAVAELSKFPWGDGTWHTILPLSEGRRLAKLYAETAAVPLADYPRLDLIVVLTTETTALPPLPGPSGPDWVQCYANDDFRVWRRAAKTP